MEVIRTERGGEMLVFKGFLYAVNRRTEQRIYWVCRKRETCKAKIVTDVSKLSVVRVSNDHSHAPDPTEISCLKIRLEMKASAGENA